MSSFKTDVDYWLQIQLLNGGPRRCPDIVKQQLRLAKSRYRHQFHFHALRREIAHNIAETITLKNCHRHLFKNPQTAPPAMIDGHSRSAQPHMWREHFRNVFEADETIYEGGVLDEITELISEDDINLFRDIDVTDLNKAIVDINTNKSYARHFHWKNLHSENHSAKLSLVGTVLLK